MNNYNKVQTNRKFPKFSHYLIILGYFILFSLPFSAFAVLPDKYKTIGMLLSYIIPMILTIYATKKTFNKQGFPSFEFKHKELLVFVIIGAFAFLIVGESTVLLIPEPTGVFKELFEQLNQAMKTLFNDKIAGYIMVAIAAPLLEEILFRGIVLRALLKKYSPWKAIIISAVFFGIFHLNPWQFLYATVLGIYLGYIYWKTKSLFYPILIHWLLNSTAFIFGQFQDPTENISTVLTGKEKIGMFILVIISMAVIYFLYQYFEKYFSKVPREWVAATGNPHKIKEIENILPDDIKISDLKTFGHKEELKETGKTLKENALQKMRQIAYPYDVDAMADDTGLEVEALNNAPGVYSARYAGEKASYEDNVKKLLKEMEGKENRKAKFRTIIALSDGPKEWLFEGEVEGKIAAEPRGDRGFGYDSVFIPEGYDKTFAEMTDEEKNKISHRAKALEKLKNYLDERSS